MQKDKDNAFIARHLVDGNFFLDILDF